MDWAEKREANNMVPMNMGYQQDDIMRLILGQNLLTKKPYSGSRVNNDGPATFKI